MEYNYTAAEKIRWTEGDDMPWWERLREGDEEEEAWARDMDVEFKLRANKIATSRLQVHFKIFKSKGFGIFHDLGLTLLVMRSIFFAALLTTARARRTS